MEWFEILIIISTILFVVSIFTINIVLKLKGKKTLGSDCACNGSCSTCHKQCINCQKILDEYHKSCAK